MECFIDYAEIGKRLRQARKSKNWTQAKLAEAVGCSTANITNIEKAKTKLSLNMFIRIIEILEVSADEIIGPKRPSDPHALSPAEMELREIYANLSSEDAHVCQRACIEFCAAFSRHLTQI